MNPGASSSLKASPSPIFIPQAERLERNEARLLGASFKRPLWRNPQASGIRRRGPHPGRHLQTGSLYLPPGADVVPRRRFIMETNGRTSRIPAHPSASCEDRPPSSTSERRSCGGTQNWYAPFIPHLTVCRQLRARWTSHTHGLFSPRFSRP